MSSILQAVFAFMTFLSTHKDLIAKLEAVGVDGQAVFQAFLNHSGPGAILTALEKLLKDAEAVIA